MFRADPRMMVRLRQIDRFDDISTWTPEKCVESMDGIYPITCEEVQVLLSGSLRPEPRPPMRLAEAVNYVQMANNSRIPLEPRRKRALRNLRTLCENHNLLKRTHIRPLVYAIFNDLDLLFYNGVLRDQICLKFFSRREGREKETLGETRERGSKAVRVENKLCAVLLDPTRTRTLERLLDVILHEMVHAYLFICCGQDQVDRCRLENETDGHGLAFSRVLGSVQRLATDIGLHIDLSAKGNYRLDL